MPLPLAMMIPFMGIQSAVMAKQFGENFQYGKRRISAMSNKDFNKLTPKILQEHANAELKSMIPSMEASIIDMQDFQKFVIKQFIGMIEELIHSMPQYILDILQIDIKLHDDEITPPPPPPPPVDEPKSKATYPYQDDAFLMSASKAILSQMRIDALKGLYTDIQKAEILRVYKLRFIDDIVPPPFKDYKETEEYKFLLALQAPIDAKIIALIKAALGKPKKTAGQSQKLERARLIKLLYAKFITWRSQKNNLGSGHWKTVGAYNAMTAVQVQLVMLLIRYTFK